MKMKTRRMIARLTSPVVCASPKVVGLAGRPVGNLRPSISASAETLFRGV